MAPYHNKLYNALNITILSKMYITRLRSLAKSWHTHNIASENYDKATTGIELDILDFEGKAFDAALEFSIATE